MRSVTLFDPQLASMADLSAQFFLDESCFGKRRDESSRPKLAELNEYVPVSVLTDVNNITQLDANILKRFQVVVVTEQSLSTQLRLNQLIRSISTCAFIQADVRGLCAQVFCDFGANFIVSDATGEAPIVGLVGGVTQESDGTVTSVDETRHGLEEGDFVTFREVKGMVELNGCAPRAVTIKGPFTFSIGDTTSFSAYEAGGIFEQVKQPKSIAFFPLAEAMREPKFVTSDFGKMDRQPQLHLAFETLSTFQEQHHRLPMAHHKVDAAEFVQIAQRLATDRDSIDTVDSGLLRDFSFTCAGRVAPMCAFIGGLVGQEVLKACSGKFHPIDQFFYFDAFECLPRDVTQNGITQNGIEQNVLKSNDLDFDKTPASDFQGTGDRYDGQVAVFGKGFQAALGQLKGFVVGAGAIGCELLKLFALMGVGTSVNGGELHVTDMDTIEKSNLNRQFLFRPWDVTSPKSRTAAEAVTRINPQLTGHIHPRLDRVGPETEETFNDAFYSSLDFVANALDNMEARKYVDRRCVFYHKPLLESGTLGTKGNTQMVIPHLSESYNSSQDPPEKTIPFCTLHNFPNSIEHTIQWAMDAFHGLFCSDAETANLFLSSPVEFKQSLLGNNNSGANGQKDRLERVLKMLVTERPLSFEACVTWARHTFEEFFANNIKQLLFNFPRDVKTSSGAAFWSGPKRAPTPLLFNPADPTHMDFIVAAANMRAENYGLKGSRDPVIIRQILANTIVPEFQPKSGVAIQVNESEPVPTPTTGDSASEIQELMHALPDLNEFIGFRLHPIEFEKDDDTNWHVDWVTATANLRAINYEITPADRYTIKQIAGKIIPAIATTTAVVAGLVGLELYKLVAGPRTLDRFKNGFVNLALPFTAFSEPIAAPRNRYGETEWTLWDRFEVAGDPTLGELLNIFQTQHRISITMLSYGSSMLYGFVRSKEVIAERLKMSISKLVESVSKKTISAHQRSLVLEMLAEDLEGNDIEVPYIVVNFCSN